MIDIINQYWLVLLLVALVVVASLAWYTGKLLAQLQQQKREQAQQKQVQQEKEQALKHSVQESVQVIALAVTQQQCNLSEAAIRITHLLGRLAPIDDTDYPSRFPATYELYEGVKHMPTHDARKALKKSVIRQLDIEREELEAQLESKILPEMAVLKQFQN